MTYQIALDDELIVDNFAGGGGASCGLEIALKRPVNIAINHDKDAIGMHEANHPLTKHYCEDVWDIDPHKVCKGRPVGLAWFSPDCKHFSKAKGGKPVEKTIRGLAWVAVRWAATVKPRIIMLENVEEFVTWGPLRKMRDEDGEVITYDDGTPKMEPCPLRRGMTFKSFVNALKKRGYAVEWQELRACDFGAPTIRKRLFLVARRDGKPIVWPKPTHGAAGSGLKPYRTAAECIDWTLPCPSIFGRKRPLVENTMSRIAKGFKRFVMDADKPFIVTCNHGGDGFRGQSLDEPMCTITAAHDAHGLVTPFLTEHANGSGQRNFDINEPLRTQCAQVKGGHFALVSAWVAKHFGGMTGVSIETPLPTITTRGTQNQICTAHVMKMRGNAGRDKHGHAMDEPLHTVSASGCHHAAVQAYMVEFFGNSDKGRDLREPAPTIMTKEKYALVKVMKTWYYLLDIGMRMLAPRELYRAQSFPDSYIIDRTAGGKKLPKTAQVRMCGNSVPPVMAAVLAAANYKSQWLTDKKQEEVS